MTQATGEMTVTEFMDALASGTPTPGGGGAAAVAGAMAAALVSMVCNLTIGRKRYAEAEDEMRTIVAASERLRADLQRLADEDIEAFNQLSAAYKLPRATEADSTARAAAIQESLRGATETPLRTAQAAAAVLPLCLPVADRGNQAAISDVGAAGFLALAGVQTALLNIDINMRSIDNAEYVAQIRATVDALVAQAETDAAAVRELVASRLRS